MSRIIGLINQKGGVGKTTTVANLGAAFAQLKKKVLLIDMDPQANLSYYLLGEALYNLESSIYDCLIGAVKLEDVLIKRSDGLDIIPSGVALSGFETEPPRKGGKESLLKVALGPMQEYDYVFIDCPPFLGLLTLNALVAVEEVFIPLQVEFFALQGIARLLETIGVVKERLNSCLKVSRIVLCLYDRRRKLSEEMEVKIRDYFKSKVFKTVIRENVSLVESASYGQSIFEYAPQSHGAEDYLSLAKEVIKYG